METSTAGETALSELISDGLSAVNGSILVKKEEDVNSPTLSSTQVELQLKDEVPSVPGTVSDTIGHCLIFYFFISIVPSLLS